MSRPRVLVVEDDHVVAELVARIAEHVGFLTRISSGLTSAHVCEEFSPDIIVLDIFMPEIDGFEVLRYLAESHHRVSIIILSGTNSSFRNMAERMGQELGLSVVANVAKPFTISQLQAVFEEAKQRHPSHATTQFFAKNWFTANH